MLWINGTNDIAYSLKAFKKSYDLPKGEKTLSIRVRMPHSHQDGWKPEEIYVFADSLCRDGIPLAKIRDYGMERSYGWIEFESQVDIVKGELNFTKDDCHWRERKWETVKAKIEKSRIEAKIPYGTKSFFFNIIDKRYLTVSTPYISL